MGFTINFGRRQPPQTRQRMIRETSAFLTWALAADRPLPRVPIRRVAEGGGNGAAGGGGFTDLMRRPGARALARHWWQRALDSLPDGG